MAMTPRVSWLQRQYRVASLAPCVPPTSNDACQHLRPSLYRGLGLNSLWLDHNKICVCLRRPLRVEVVFQWRNQWIRTKYALEGDYSHGR